MPAFFVLPLLLASFQEPQLSFEKEWDKEQQARGAASQILNDPKASPDAILGAIQDLRKLIEYCQKPEIRALKNGEGKPLLLYQVSDIDMQIIGGYARLKDVAKTLATVREMVQALTGPDTWIKADDFGTFTFYANQLQSNRYLAALPPNQDLRDEINRLRHRDPNFMLTGYPYSTAQSEKLSVEDKVAGLSLLWSEAKYNFANFRLLPNLDWDTVYRDYLPKVAAARSTYDYYNRLREFLANLHDSHTDVSLPWSIAGREEVRLPLPTLRVGDRVVVWIEPSEDFRKLGFRKGDVIRNIDGVDAIEYGQKTWANRVSCSTPQDADMRVYSYMLLRGPVARPLRLQVEHADHQVQSIVIDRRKPLEGVTLPPYEFKVLSDGTAYFAFNTCGNDEPSKGFAKVLPEIRKAGRLIIDCRMNDGGNSGVGYSILSHLIDHDVPASKWEMRAYVPSIRTWREPMTPLGGVSTVQPDKDPFDGPVAVLCGPRTFSAGEDFLVAWKMAKRGKLIGMPSGGSTGQPLSIQLPGGGWARICAKHDCMADGTEFVGVGVQPDLKVWTNVQAIRNGKDPVLEAAIREVNP